MPTSRKCHSSASRAFVTRKRFSACWGNSPIPIEPCLRHRAAASPFHSAPRKADVHRMSCARSGCFNGRSCQRKNRSESPPGLKKHLLVLTASAFFVVLVYTLFPVCTQRGTVPDRADCFADHLIIQRSSFTVALIVDCAICTDSEMACVAFCRSIICFTFSLL